MKEHSFGPDDRHYIDLSPDRPTPEQIQLLFESAIAPLYRLSEDLLRNQGDPGEVVQLVYQHVMQHCDEYNPSIGSVHSWFFFLCHKFCAALRKANSRKLRAEKSRFIKAFRASELATDQQVDRADLKLQLGLFFRFARAHGMTDIDIEIYLCYMTRIKTPEIASMLTLDREYVQRSIRRSKLVAIAWEKEHSL